VHEALNWFRVLQGERTAANAGIPFLVAGRVMTARGLKASLLALLNPEAAAAAAAARAAAEAGGAPQLTREAARAAVRNVRLTGGWFVPPPLSSPEAVKEEDSKQRQSIVSRSDSISPYGHGYRSAAGEDDAEDDLLALGEMEADDGDDDWDDELEEDGDDGEGEIELSPATGRAFSLKPKRMITVGKSGASARSGSKLRLSGSSGKR